MFGRAGRRLGNWLDHYSSDLAKAFATIGFGIVGIIQGRVEGVLWFVSSAPGIIFLFAAAFTLYGTYAGVRRARATRPLQKRNEQLEQTLEQVRGHYFDLCSDELSNLLRNTLGYGDNERISAYRHRGGVFQIMGRYSENPEYNEPGRPTYPADEGVICSAWQDGRASAELPSPEHEKERYYEALERDWNIPSVPA